jgi:hypothetical protein
VQSFAWEAAGKLRAALRHARAVTACELLAGFQAADARREPAPAGLAGRDRRSDRGGPAVRRGHRASHRSALAPGVTGRHAGHGSVASCRGEPRHGHENELPSLKHRSYQNIRRGCRVHVVVGAWLGHPRRMNAGTDSGRQSQKLAGSTRTPRTSASPGSRRRRTAGR